VNLSKRNLVSNKSDIRKKFLNEKNAGAIKFSVESTEVNIVGLWKDGKTTQSRMISTETSEKEFLHFQHYPY
jgi:hypothetical protein